MADNEIVGDDTKNADYDTKNVIEDPSATERRIKYFAERQIKERTRIGVTRVQAKKALKLGYTIEEV
ncbi:hypothetical protein BGZ49_006617, partial [Haplosporangium sp. Z 27]